MINSRTDQLILHTALLLLILTGACSAAEVWGDYLPIGEYCALLDPAGNILTETGRRVYVGDQYLDQENKLYEVVEVGPDGLTAQTEFLEQIELELVPLADLRRRLGLAVADAQVHDKGRIAVYHTHNAESYVPTDGTDSINGKGGIHHVGKAFADAMHKRGIEVDYSQQLHLPHDRGAYRRSRETVLELLSKKPDAIFDVHRDAAPQSAYAVQLKDEWMTRIQFVVGRQNQNLGINRQYAQSLKKIGDELYPGLIKGIFFGRGNYNQDLSPLSLLLEVGAHTNSRPAAERGASLFAEVVDLYFYGPSAEAAGLGQNKTARRSVSTLLLFVAAGSLIFYVINAGGITPAWERLSSIFKRIRNR